MYVIFDIGGTKTRVAVSEDLKSYGTPIKFETPMQYEAGVEAICSAALELTGGKPITAIAGGIRGPLKKDKTGISNEVVLTDWINKPLTIDIENKLSAPVFLENDSAIVGLGEAVYGAGKEGAIVAYFTVSTGVGGARYVNGVLDVTSIGFEPGHQILDIDGSIFGSDTLHTLENLISGSALERRRGCKPYEIAQDDPVWDELAGYLAVGLRNAILFWSPDVIVLGGSMVVGDPRIMLEVIREKTVEALRGFVPCPIIVDAALRDEGGLYGAMALIKSKQK
ncbi:MAG: hypothetical protein RL538_25 [Candidatus Parcubacteria bacterium]|jgi:glucokinase